MRHFLLILITACTAPHYAGYDSGTGKVLELSDKAYEPEIKTVRLFSLQGFSPRPDLNPAVTRMGTWSLVLEFDDLRNQRDNYYLRIMHCNHNWTKSALLDLDFMPEYNEFPINDFEFSLDTQIPYVHYTVGLPPVKLPGNYVAVVYRGSDRNDVILTRRFMVFDPQFTFLREGSLIGPGSVAERNQQINFKINYKSVNVINPLETVNVTVRQNQRWDNLSENVKPSFLRENKNELEYRFFSDERMFKGGNEFRFFDLRSLIYPGRNIGYVDRKSIPPKVYIAPDKSREGEAYSMYADYNGNYILDNLDFRIKNSANYADVQFTLLAENPVDGEVYVIGAFTDWRTDQSTRMRYDSASKAYHTNVLLRQGWYDYQYLVKSNKLPPYHFEGSHYETENMYEIFVYYRAFQPNADLLLGYFILRDDMR
ncbi:MAG: type IX secretion system plug protein domain-containing protein [Cyclobacteriaceae bacterium]